MMTLAASCTAVRLEDVGAAKVEAVDGGRLVAREARAVAVRHVHQRRVVQRRVGRRVVRERAFVECRRVCPAAARAEAAAAALAAGARGVHGCGLAPAYEPHDVRGTWICFGGSRSDFAACAHCGRRLAGVVVAPAAALEEDEELGSVAAGSQIVAGRRAVQAFGIRIGRQQMECGGVRATHGRGIGAAVA
eukprot:1997072-Prymnesium_polylepis.1